MTYVSCCFFSINNRLLVMKCYSSLEVSGFSRNEFNSFILFNFCCRDPWVHCLAALKLAGFSNERNNFLFKIITKLL
jgi:hypothetical protein